MLRNYPALPGNTHMPWNIYICTSDVIKKTQRKTNNYVVMRRINKLHHLLNGPWIVRIKLFEENWMLTLLQRELYMYPSFFSSHSVVTNVIFALIWKVTISVMLPQITLCFWNLWTRIWKYTKLQALCCWLSDIKKR